MADKERKEFEAWMKRVDGFLEKEFLLDSKDLPDRPYWDEWQDGMTPVEAAKEALEYAGWEG